MVQSGVRVIWEALGTLASTYGGGAGALGIGVSVASRAQRPLSRRGEPKECGGRCPVRRVNDRCLWVWPGGASVVYSRVEE